MSMWSVGNIVRVKNEAIVDHQTPQYAGRNGVVTYADPSSRYVTIFWSDLGVTSHWLDTELEFSELTEKEYGTHVIWCDLGVGGPPIAKIETTGIGFARRIWDALNKDGIRMMSTRP